MKEENINIQLIKDKLKESNMTINKLAKGSGLGYATCHDMVSGKKSDIKLSTAYKIAKALNISLDEFIKE